MLRNIFTNRVGRVNCPVPIAIGFSSKLLLRGRKRPGARWLLPLVFVAGYVATLSRFENSAAKYSALTGVAIIACCFLLGRLNKPRQFTLPFWVILAVFILAYYFKFYWIALFPEMGVGKFRLFDIFFGSTDALTSAFTTTTYAFAAFCLVAWFLLGKSPIGESRSAAQRAVSSRRRSEGKYSLVSMVALWMALILVVITTIIMYVSGIAVMGVEGVIAPFRLVGLVFYTRLVFVPAILLLLIWSSQRAGLHKRATLGVILLILYGLGDMLLRSSRSGLAGLLLSLGFLFLASGSQVRKRHLVFFAGGLLLVSFLYPIISDYRGLRIKDSPDIVSSLVGARSNVLGDGVPAWGAALVNGIQSLLFRLTGVDMLVVYHGLGVQPLGNQALYVLTAPRGLSGYVTINIFGFSPNDITAEAPSLVGWFFLVGGHTMVVVGLAGFTFLVYVLWKILIRMRLRSLPVAQALFLSLVFMQATEGTLDGLVGLPILAWPVSIAVCEWLVRRGEEMK